jgi:hypothetical protein
METAITKLDLEDKIQILIAEAAMRQLLVVMLDEEYWAEMTKIVFPKVDGTIDNFVTDEGERVQGHVTNCNCIGGPHGGYTDPRCR